MPDDLADIIRQRRGGAAPEETTSIADIIRARRGMTEMTGEEVAATPNEAEAAIGEFVKDKPVLQDILAWAGRPLSAAANVASGVVRLVRGDPDAALQRLRSAAMNLRQFSPVGIFTEGEEPEDVRSFGKVLKEEGVPPGPVIDLPIIGNVTTRGLAGFGVDVWADPLRTAQVNQITKAGKAARVAGALERGRASFGGGGVPRLIGPKAAQAAAGQRAFLQMYGVPIIKGARAIAFLETLGAKITGRALRAFNVDRGFPQILADLNAARSVGGKVRLSEAEFAAQLLKDTMQKAADLGIDVDQAFAQALMVSKGRPGRATRLERTRLMEESARVASEADALKARGTSIENEAARMGVVGGMHTIRQRLPGADTVQRHLLSQSSDLLTQAQAARAKAASLAEQARALRRDILPDTPEAARLVDQYVKDGFSPKEAIRAARAVTLYGVDPTWAPYGARLLQQQLRLGRQDVQFGATLTTLNDPGKVYIEQVMPRDTAAFLGHRKNRAAYVAAKAKISEWSAKNPTMLQRIEFFEGKPIPEIQKWAEDTIPGFKDAGLKFFEDNPAKIAAARAEATGKVATASSFWQRVIDDYARPTNEWTNAAQWMPVEDVLKTSNLRAVHNLAVGAGRSLPPEIVAAAKSVASILEHPQAATVFVKTWDTVSRWLKIGAVSWPESRVRDMISDAYMNFIDGVVNPMSYAKAIGVRTGKNVTIQTPHGPVSAASLMREMTAGEALGRIGQLSAEELATPPAAPGSLRAKAGAVARVAFAPVRAWTGGMKAVAQASSDVSRLANVINKLEKGIPIDDAISSMKAALGDWHALTPFERGTMARLVLFYRWLRFNTPLMVRTLIEKPGKVSAVAHVQRAMQGALSDEGQMDRTVVPEWMQRRIFGLTRDDDGSVRTFTGLGIGLEDLSIFDRPLTELLAGMNPLIKATVQAATNTDIFRQTTLDRASVAPSILRHLPQPFLDLIAFKPVQEPNGEVRFYRADPRYLNILNAMPGSRALGIFSRFDPEVNEEQTYPALRSLVGWRTSKVDPAKLASQRMTQAIIKYLESLWHQGDVLRIDRYVIPRTFTDGLTEDERKKRRESNWVVNELKRAKAALRQLETEEGQPAALRSGTGN